MELGLEYTDKMAIPPGQTAFPLSGYCVADCTRAALPRTGIIIFGSQLHTHLRGVRVLTRHFRGEQELREVNRDDFYSNHFQEMRTLHYKPRVLPVSESWSFTLSLSFFRETSTSLQGDALVTTCYYNTLADKNATLGGFSISDEMCVNYIHYYPATKLEVCKSSVSEETLENYFIYMKRWVWKSHFPLFLQPPLQGPLDPVHCASSKQKLCYGSGCGASFPPALPLKHLLHFARLRNIHNGNVFNFLTVPKATTPRCTR